MRSIGTTNFRARGERPKRRSFEGLCMSILSVAVPTVGYWGHSPTIHYGT